MAAISDQVIRDSSPSRETFEQRLEVSGRTRLITREKFIS